MSKVLAAARFKAQCLALLDQVAITGEDLVVTKRGRPVARIVPVEAPASLRGSVTFMVSDEDLIVPLPEQWDADRSDRP
ncbi:MAG: type II toxin-antitoxin system Phd/YefM family antitoxin [Solirubrobacteraceae bacterium]